MQLWNFQVYSTRPNIYDAFLLNLFPMGLHLSRRCFRSKLDCKVYQHKSTNEIFEKLFCQRKFDKLKIINSVLRYRSQKNNSFDKFKSLVLEMKWSILSLKNCVLSKLQHTKCIFPIDASCINFIQKLEINLTIEISNKMMPTAAYVILNFFVWIFDFLFLFKSSIQTCNIDHYLNKLAFKMNLSENFLFKIFNVWDHFADGRSEQFPLTKNLYWYLGISSIYLLLQFVSNYYKAMTCFKIQC